MNAGALRPVRPVATEPPGSAGSLCRSRCPRTDRVVPPRERPGAPAPGGNAHPRLPPWPLPAAAAMPKERRLRTGDSRALPPREMRASRSAGGGPQTPARRELWPTRVPREPWAGWAGCESPPAADVRRGGAWGERGPREQHRDPAQRAGGGGWKPWPWGWITAGSVGERVKESRRPGRGLARLRERKEAEEERSGEHPARRVCRGAPFPQEAACVA